MARFILLLAVLLVTTRVLAQFNSAFTAKTDSLMIESHAPQEQSLQENIIVEDNMVFKTTFGAEHKATNENEIRVLEELESKALLKRDMVTLMLVWARNFSADMPANTLIQDENPLPYYVHFNRSVEHLIVKDSVAYTSGTETFIPLEGFPKSARTINQTFSHTWEKHSGRWKLVMKYTYKKKE